MTFGRQSFSIEFDTGSADTLANPGAYDPKKSQDSKKTGKSFSAAYGDGTAAQGTIYTDSFEIAGLQARDVAIGCSSSEFIKDEDESQGISGMSFPSIQTFPKSYPPFFVSLMKQKAVSQGVFQFTLKHGSNSDSILHLGSVDHSKAKGPLKYVDVDPSLGFWVVDASINGKSIKAIVDSGSTINSGPQAQVEEVIRTIPGMEAVQETDSVMYVFSCEQTPNVTISIAGLDVKLGHDQTRYGKTDDGRCVFPIAALPEMPLNAWILGDTFFQMTTIVFDMAQHRMGFALQA